MAAFLNLNPIEMGALKKETTGDFPGSPVVKTLPSSAGGMRSIPGQGAKMTHILWPKIQRIKQKQYSSKFNEDFKNHPHKKKNLKKKKKK